VITDASSFTGVIPWHRIVRHKATDNFMVKYWSTYSNVVYGLRTYSTGSTHGTRLHHRALLERISIWICDQKLRMRHSSIRIDDAASKSWMHRLGRIVPCAVEGTTLKRMKRENRCSVKEALTTHVSAYWFDGVRSMHLTRLFRLGEAACYRGNKLHCFCECVLYELDWKIALRAYAATKKLPCV